HVVGDSRPLLALDQVDSPLSERTSADALGADKRIFLIPDAHLLVVIPQTNNQLHLHRLNIDDALAKSTIDYLFVASQPPASVRRGGEWTYQMAVKSKKGGLKYRVASGPKGMEVSPDGFVKWKAPADSTETVVDVILTVSDSAGQEAFHTFKLGVGDRELADNRPPPKDGEAMPKDGDPKPKDGDPKPKDGDPKPKDGDP